MEHELLESIAKSILSGELVCLDLSNKQLTDLDFMILARYLTIESSRVQKIILDNNDLYAAAKSGAGLEAFVKAINSNQQLISLSLNNTNLNNAVFAEFVKVVASQPLTSLQVLSISNNELTEDAITDCCSLFKSCHNLQVLNLSANYLNDEGCVMLAAVVNSCQLLSLNLQKTCITHLGLQALTAALEFNRDLHTLDVSENKIGDIGALALAGLIGSLGTNIRELNANTCEISNYGAKVLFNSIARNSTLRKVSLAGNKLNTAEGLDNLIRMNRSLESIDLSHNSIASNSLNAAFASLVSNHVLSQIMLNQNLISPSAAHELAKYLPANDSLLKLDLSGNCIDIVAAKFILEAAAEHPSLVKVNLSNNFFNPHELFELESILKQRSSKRIKYILKEGNDDAESNSSLSSNDEELYGTPKIRNVI